MVQIPLYNGEPVVQSVRDALASAIQTEKLANGQPVPPAVPPKPIARKYFSSLTGVNKGSSLHGQVLHVQNPDSFYVRFDESDVQKFSMFDSQLQTEYNAPDARSAYEVGVPQKGILRLNWIFHLNNLLLIVFFHKQGFPYVFHLDGRWYRILVEDIVGDDQFSAFFVDTGLRQTAKSVDMLQILDRWNLQFFHSVFSSKN